MKVPATLKQRLAQANQSYLLQWWDELNDDQRHRLVQQLESIDFDLIARLLNTHSTSDATSSGAERARPPRDLIGRDNPSSESPEREQARARGIELLKAGKVGAIVVAGGQGTRLGFPHPKGLFPIGPVSNAVLFQFLCGQIQALSQRYGVSIPYYVMTSDATHDEVVQGFKNHDYFGLPHADVRFFRQGHMPAVDAQSGELLLADKESLALSPDGHGGMLAALAAHGLLDDMRRRGVEQIYYHQVDNPCLRICDPEFLGFHDLSHSEMSTKVVRKVTAEEKMGLLVDLDGTTQIIEYSNISPELAAQTDADGELLLWAGNTACHAFSREFLERLASDDALLPFHRAFKKVPFLNPQGQLVEPDEPNAFKFERFIFDALPQANVALVVETERAREFGPIKNAEGNDSPATCRATLQANWREWLGTAGIELPPDVSVEIQPSFAIDADDIVRKRDQIPSPVNGQLLLK